MVSKYIYGFIETESGDDFEIDGVGENSRVTTIGYRDIAAVVSDHPVIDFDEVEENDLKKYIQQHQIVNEQVMQSHTILPLKFGNIAQNETEVRKVLQQAYIQFKTLLKLFRGKVELVVQASANRQMWIQEIIDSNGKINGLTAKLNSSNDISIKVEIGKLIHDAMVLKEDKIVSEILTTLRNGGHSHKSDRLLGDEMIFNASFLIAKSAESAFDRKLDELAQRFGSMVSFRCIGPMPPYSFIKLDLKTPDSKTIAAARKALNLPAEASRQEIKKAYRTLAAKYHPDKGGRDGRRFNEIHSAYRTLETYCDNYRYSFDEQAIKETLLIEQEF